jgi:hypothetical protein
MRAMHLCQNSEVSPPATARQHREICENSKLRIHLMIREATIADATLIAARPSTKNKGRSEAGLL